MLSNTTNELKQKTSNSGGSSCLGGVAVGTTSSTSSLLLPDMHLQWLNIKSTVALIDVNPISGKYQVLAQASTQQEMIENAAVLVCVLKRAHASRFKMYQEKLERDKVEK